VRESGTEGRHDANRAIPVPERATGGRATFPEVKLLGQRVFRDAHGAFAEVWREENARVAGLPRFVQDNIARSVKAVVRGLHFQSARPQAKLVTVALGEIFDVAVDVRVGSPTFGRWTAYHLSDSNGRQLYIPPGFAHAYQTLSDVSVVTYKCSDVYSPDDERAVRWDDSEIAIDWPIRDAIVSDRDAAAPRLRDVFSELLPHLDR
jgi:dTDP-4-dehydrorhamnose 3,5-epimerase